MTQTEREELKGITPGPWHVMDTPAMRAIFNGCAVIVSEHVDDAVIALIAEDVAGYKENGKLLAAAPNLLAENARMRELLEDVARRIDIGSEYFDAIATEIEAFLAEPK